MERSPTVDRWQHRPARLVITSGCGTDRCIPDPAALSSRPVAFMLKVTGAGSLTTCDGITRRDFLQVGTLGALGLTLSHLSMLKAMGATAPGSDEKACIMIFNLGAPSQLDTFDMKPNAPREIRGPF